MQTDPQKTFDRGILAIAVSAAVVLFFLFYPPFYGFRDEGIYLGMADALLHGKFFISPLEYPVSITIETGGRHLPFYPVANSILLMPLLASGWKNVFLLGLIAHLLSFTVFIKFAKGFGSDNTLTRLLYLFFPAFVFFSRTVMSDIPSLVCFLAAYVFYFGKNKKNSAAGFFLGLSLFFRVANAVMVLPFIMGSLMEGIRQKKGSAFLGFCAGLAPLAILAAAYNTFVYGAPWLTGYSETFTGVRSFEMKYFMANCVHYLSALNLAYPLMLLVFLFDRRMRRLEIYLLLVLHFLFFGFYYFHDKFPGKIPTLIFGTRFFFPLMPFFILSYGSLLDPILSRVPKLKIPAAAVLLVLLSASSFLIHRAHQQAVRPAAEASGLIYAVTPENSMVIYDSPAAELVQRYLGRREYSYYDATEEFLNSLQVKAQSTDIYSVLSASADGEDTEILHALAPVFDAVPAGKTERITVYRLKLKG